jgi:hypothetical protein
MGEPVVSRTGTTEKLISSGDTVSLFIAPART